MKLPTEYRPSGFKMADAQGSGRVPEQAPGVEADPDAPDREIEKTERTTEETSPEVDRQADTAN